MLDVKQRNTNIPFYGRNMEIRKAQQILHKIKSDFPASSSYMADLSAQKRDLKLQFPDTEITMPAIIEQYHTSDKVGAKTTNSKIHALRVLQKNYLDNDYNYCDSLIYGIKKLKVMNCKENAELAYLIAKMNGYKNCHCVHLAKELPDSELADLGHTIFLLNQELPQNMIKLDKFYIEDIYRFSAFIPSKKSIVIDPLFGIVDYWNNAIQEYKSIFPQISKVKDLYVGVREAIIENAQDFKKFKKSHPELIIPSLTKVNKPKLSLFNRIINYLQNLNKN